MTFSEIHEIFNLTSCIEQITTSIKTSLKSHSEVLSEAGRHNAGSLERGLVTTQISITKFYSE